MADRTPTAEQHVAIVARGAVAVRAGAGSGKTTVLAERFVHLLRPDAADGPSPEVGRLLAITFTEKAAAEMRGRIRALVGREIREHPDQRGHWAQVQRDLLGAHISTIHAFCARIVREHPIETRVDPDARVLDADETRRYLDARVEHHLLDLATAQHPGMALLLRRGRGLRGGRSGGAVGTTIGLLQSLARLGRRGEWLPGAVTRHQETPAEPLAPMVEALVGAIESKIGGRTSKTVQRLVDGWPIWKDALLRLPDVEAGTLPQLAPALADLGAVMGRARLDGPAAGMLKLASGRLKGPLIEAVASRVMRGEARTLAELVAEVDARLRVDKRRDAVLTFDDLILIARDLVVDHPPVRAALARRFDAVLLDECQDTDPAQAELLRAITPDGGPALFVVGDEKQAIYGFRGADVEVFERLLRDLPERVALGRNFRSVPSILAFVNAMGAKLLERPADAMLPGAWTTFGPDHMLRPDREEAPPPTAVRLVTAAHELVRRKIDTAAGRRELEARILAEVLHDLVRGSDEPVRAGDVTVLFRSLREVKVYERALSRRGVPYHVVGGRGFFQRQEVRDVLALLAVVADPGDEIALATVLRSPWVGLPDDALWALVRDGRRLRAGFEEATAGDEGMTALVRFRGVLGELRRMRSRATVSEVLGHAIETLDLDAVLLAQPQGEQQTANVRKVLELARIFGQGPHGGLSEFVAWMRRRDAGDLDEPEALLASEEADVVRLMTIHQSKGLEFPVVVLADIGRPLRHDYDTLVVDEAAGVAPAPLLGAGGHAIVPTEMVQHRRRLAERARAEHARLFYVACTRAKDRLVLIDATTTPDRLEGKASKSEAWGHAVWDVVGHENVSSAGAVTASTLVEIGPEAKVLVEPASIWLADASDVGENTVERQLGAETDVDPVRVVENVLAWEVAPPATIECTPTEIAEFRLCPRRWWYQSVVGVREAGQGGRRARVLGALVHGALERWASGAADDATHALGPSLPFRVPDPAQRAEVEGDVEGAIAWLRAERADGARLVGREKPFVLALGSDVIVRGRIDAVLERDGTTVVRDYKYARAPEVVGPAYRDQLAIYAVAMSRAGHAAIAAELLYLRPEPTVRAVGVERDEDVVANAVEAARAIQDARVAGDIDAVPRGPDTPDECRRLGCGHVRRCWLSDSARDAPARRAGA